MNCLTCNVALDDESIIAIHGVAGHKLGLSYKEWIIDKMQASSRHGFRPTFVPDFLFDFQVDLLQWATEKGRAAIFADCGLGKTPMQLAWAQNVVGVIDGVRYSHQNASLRSAITGVLVKCFADAMKQFEAGD